MLDIKCGVPQGSILGPLLFFLYVNDLKYASKILDPIMFADDTNLFYSHVCIKTLFETSKQRTKQIKQMVCLTQHGQNQIHLLSQATLVIQSNEIISHLCYLPSRSIITLSKEKTLLNFLAF